MGGALDRQEWNSDRLVKEIPNWHQTFLNSLAIALERIRGRA
jgi:hypothetical protein